MQLIFKNLAFVLILVATTVVRAQVNSEISQEKHLSIKSMRVREISHDILVQDKLDTLSHRMMNPQGYPLIIGQPSPVNPATQVIAIAKDLVALGQEVYALVIKGKPTNVTSYAPISIVPKVNGVPADILETEYWRAPVKRTFEVVYENYYNAEVVKFRYSVIYSYGGSYAGKGAYLTSVQIVPEHVRTLFGYDFTATMKLGGIQNQGTRENPIAGATILMEYTIKTVMVAENNVSSFFITGQGNFKKF